MFVSKKCTRDYVPSFFFNIYYNWHFRCRKVRLEGQMEFFGLILSLLIIQSKATVIVGFDYQYTWWVSQCKERKRWPRLWMNKEWLFDDHTIKYLTKKFFFIYLNKLHIKFKKNNEEDRTIEIERIIYNLQLFFTF